MSNGQRRNRRGARPRPAPHKHGGAGSGRAATQLIPPISAPSKTSGDPIGDPSSDPINEIVNDAVASDTVTVASPDASQNNETEVHDRPAPPASLSVTEGADAPSGEALDDRADDRANHHNHHTPAPTAASEAPASPASRSRFDRFYAPGQGARGERSERGERVAPPIAAPQATPMAPPPPRRRERAERVERFERVERAAHIKDALEEDDGAEYAGPRSDIRGSVGTLVDALHEVFARDRAMASQSGVARCGVCYLHFPVDELTYRDGEGFYVCASCAHALGAARVPMVRRQQRQ